MIPRNWRSLARTFLGCGVAMLCVGALSIATDRPLLFPAIGASAFLAFAAPRSPLSQPRNVVIGHLIGTWVGYAALLAFAVEPNAPWLAGDGAWRAVLAASSALAVTSTLMVAFDVLHPPAGATTLIVSTGLMGTPRDLVTLALSSVCLSLLAFAIHRASREPYPLWRARPVSPPH